MANKHNIKRTLLVHHGAASLFVAVLSLIAAVGLWIQFESSQDRLRVNLLEQSDRRAIQLSDAISEQFALLLRDTDFAIRELRTAWLADRDAFAAALQVVTELTADDQGTDEVLERADKALYLAKLKGRNRVELYA